MWWATTPDASIDFKAGERAWEACKAAMREQVNDENFMFDLRGQDLNAIGSTALIAEYMRKLINEL